MEALQAPKSLLLYYLLQLFTTLSSILRLVVCNACNALLALQRVTLSTPLALKTPLNKTATSLSSAQTIRRLGRICFSIAPYKPLNRFIRPFSVLGWYLARKPVKAPFWAFSRGVG